jgi:Trk K+ transport system NAD-binding subunit
VGAFVAGAALATTPYGDALGGRLVTARDFLLLFFFLDLGARLDLSLLGATLRASLVFSAFVLIGNPIIVMAIMGAMGYRKRTSFLAGLAVAQISEFSLILGALGVSVGHLGAEAMGLIATVGLVTIALSTYMILYSSRLYEWLEILERRVPYRELAAYPSTALRADFVVFGLGRYGGGIVRHLLLRGRRVIGVDFDPSVLRCWSEEGVPVVYGDAADPELFERLPLARVSWVVRTTPDIESSRVLLHHLRELPFRGRIAIAARSAEEGDRLRLEVVHLVLRPYADAAEQAADALTTPIDRLGAIATIVPALREVRLGSASRIAGHRIADVPVREEFGATVLAVSRGGRSTFNPGPDFQLFPGDRVILSGDPASLSHAVEYLARTDYPERSQAEPELVVEHVEVASMPGWAGSTLASLELPSRFGIAVLAVASEHETMRAPDLRVPLRLGERLVVAGSADALAALHAAAQPTPRESHA